MPTCGRHYKVCIKNILLYQTDLWYTNLFWLFQYFTTFYNPKPDERKLILEALAS